MGNIKDDGYEEDLEPAFDMDKAVPERDISINEKEQCFDM